MHFWRSKASSGLRWMLSGLQHHLHRSEQPLRKTTVRMPGPSLVQKCWILSTVPVSLTALSVCRLMVSQPLIAERDAKRARDLDQFARSRYGADVVKRLAQRDTLNVG